MTYLVSKSITDRTVPDVWKIECVSPLHQSEDKIHPENYWPISALPVLSNKSCGECFTRTIECTSWSFFFIKINMVLDMDIPLHKQ